GGFLSITFIPIFSRYLADDDEAGGWQALTAIIRPITVGITVLVGIGWVVAPTVIELLYPGFSAEQVANTVRFTRIVL
ncbi:MAG: murein biosynthesis integral membrane protein MurJ, partial [Actinobacteria bacterium]|nr:murein biosynthesis integral membrane protein MurJ [Actinomycetota bacterium]NIV54743.1 murein biosynthesis integral membrane protein MurJ [Actinomycetota bacterium]